MAFFDIERINRCLKEAERAVSALHSIQVSGMANTYRSTARELVYTVKNKVEDAAMLYDRAGNVTKLAPYYLFGQKMSLQAALMQLTDMTLSMAHEMGINDI